MKDTLVSVHKTKLKLANENVQQILAIKRANKFIGDCYLIEGPSGIEKIKLFTIFALLYLQYGLYILISGSTDVLGDAIIELLSEFINSSPTINFIIPF